MTDRPRRLPQVDLYRRSTVNCADLAAKAASEEERKRWLGMLQFWESRLKQAEAHADLAGI
jgi:hypothetical protein